MDRERKPPRSGSQPKNFIDFILATTTDPKLLRDYLAINEEDKLIRFFKDHGYYPPEGSMTDTDTKNLLQAKNKVRGLSIDSQALADRIGVAY